MKSKHSNEGGSALAIFAVIVTIALVGVIGWIFWQNFLKKDNTLPTSQAKVQSSKPSNEPEDSYNGERITPAGEGYSIKVPNGWKLNNPTDSNDYFDDNMLLTGPSGPSSLIYNKSEKPSIIRSEMGGWGGYAPAFTIRLTIGGFEERTQLGEVTAFTLDDGTSGSRTYTIIPKGSPGPYGDGVTEEDFITYGYKFVKDDKTLQVDISDFASTKYDQELFENVIKSIVIK